MCKDIQYINMVLVYLKNDRFETSVDLKHKKLLTPQNVLILLKECRFWYSVCSKYTNPHTYVHTRTHARSRLLQ